MSILDLQAFLRERLTRFDESIDTGAGSEADTLVIQPILRRLGPDPFAVDLRAFIMDRLNQEFPDFATRDGDALTDLLVKPGELLMDPLVRENKRVRDNLSFRDPSILTIDEAESLGANFFTPRETGTFARGPVRVYFTSPQSCSITPANFFTSRGGLTFFPDGTQGLSVDEMLFNVEGDLYYFDVNTIAEAAGDQYNIEAEEVVTIANFSAAVKVINKQRFRSGTADESVETYVNRIEQDLTERSLVTTRGVISRMTRNFPEMTRINVIGFNDPEMQRDIIKGGSLGIIRAGGRAGFSESDGEGHATTRRFKVDTVIDGPIDFTALIGPPGSSGAGFILVTHGTFLGFPPVRDLEVRTVISTIELDLEDQVLFLNPPDSINLVWELRRRELTLSDIPGGILFPDTATGTITIPSDEIHVGGSYDSYLRGTTLDSGSLVLDGISDDSPILSGVDALQGSPVSIKLNDYVLGVTYMVGDATYEEFAHLAENRYTLQIEEGVAAGTYSIFSVTQTNLLPVEITVFEVVNVFAGDRWKIIDDLDIYLNDPKETRISGTDLQTTQASDIITTSSAVDFDSFGVAVGDVVRITSGSDIGDYSVIQPPIFPSFTNIQVDRLLLHSAAGIQYSIFRPNKAGGVSLPLIRVTTIDLLDSNGQPVGSTVPYANPIGAFSTAFSNPARGTKIELADGLFGIIGIDLGSSGVAEANVSGRVLEIRYSPAGPTTISVTFVGVDPIPLSSIVAQINTAAGQVLATEVGGRRLGIIPAGTGFAEIIGGTNVLFSAIPALFGIGGFAPGTLLYLNTKMVRSETFDVVPIPPGYFVIKVSPALDFVFDVVQAMDGNQIGVYRMELVNPYPGIVPPVPLPFIGLLTAPATIVVEDKDFAPEANVRFRVGSRSFGKTTLYFLEPTTFEVDPRAMFTALLSNGTTLDFIPDYTLEAQRIPALPAGVKPKDGATTAASITFTSASTNFTAKGIRPGDVLIIDFEPVIGTVVLADPVVGLAFQFIILSLEGGADKTITFINDDTAIPVTDVTRAGVADQINNAVGRVICSINGLNQLEFEPEVGMTIRGTGSANPTLGLPLTDVNNQAENTGRYDIVTVGNTILTLGSVTPFTETRLQFTVVRPGTQRIGATQMSTQIGPTGLYTADIELLSNGTGNEYNLGNDVPMTVQGFTADGYYLTSEDSNLTFSPAEKDHLHTSRTINEVGTDDDLENATNLLGQNLQVNYNFSSLVSNSQGFLQSEQERVICASPLARHLVPHFIRFDFNYSGGPKEADVLPDVETLIHSRFPDQQLEVSDITAIFTMRGADSVVNPVTLFGVVYNVDRTVTLEKSQDRINVGRLAAFFPDVITLTRNIL